MQDKLARFFVVAYDTLEGRRVYACQRYLEKTQWLNKVDLQKLQFKRFKRLLIHAYENVPHYHRCYKKANFHPRNFNSFDDLPKIPILEKSTIRLELDTMLSRNVSKNKLECWHTSGTTAFPVKLYRGKTDLSWAVGAELRGYSWAGYKAGDKLGLVWAYERDVARDFKFRLKNFLKRRRIHNVAFLSEKSMAKFAETLHRFNPDFIRGYTYSTRLFAAYLQQNDRFRINPRAVFTVSSNLFPHYQRTIEEAFNCRVYDYYSSNEVSHIAAECEAHEGLHISEENILLEILEGDEPVNAGEEGEVLVTNLNSYSMPFIRYKIGDLAKKLSDVCSCGRAHSLIKLRGRTYEYFLNSDGSFTSLRDFATVFEDLPISEFQVVQESLDEIVIKIVRGSGYIDAHTEFIEKNIKLRGSAVIRVELIDSTPSEKSGKPRYLVSKIPTKYT